MKRFGFAAALMTLCAVAVYVAAPDAIALAFDPTVLASGAHDFIAASPLLVGGIAAARTRHGELVQQAATLLATATGKPADQVRTIEQQHAELVRQATELQAAITVEETRTAPPAPPAPPAPAPTDGNALAIRQASEQAAAAERQRFADIRAACDAVGLADQAAELFTRGLSIDQARTELLAKLAERSRQSPTNPRISITRDEGDTIRRAVESAIVLRANPAAIRGDNEENRTALAAARNWRGMSLLEIGRRYVEQVHGARVAGLGRHELATVLLGLDTLGSRAVGMQSTSDFASILANTASKRLRAAYVAAPSPWKLLGRQSNNPDFKAKSVVQLSAAPSFIKVVEGGEYKYGGLTESAESYALSTYGRIIAITRQALINDDLGAFDRVPSLMGAAAAELEAYTFWQVLIANAAMSDGTALFHADHGNLAGSGHAIGETGLAAARLAIRTQKGIAAKAADRPVLNLTPKYLVVSPDKEIEAQKALTAVLATATSDVNVFANSLQLIVDAHLSGNAWYLVVDPATFDTVEYAYLEGEQGLFTEERVGFDVDGIEIKGRVDFAAKAIDWRGMYKDGGA